MGGCLCSSASNEKEEIGMTKLWGDGHLKREDVKVVVRDYDIVEALGCYSKVLKQSDYDLSICPLTQ